MRIYSFGLLGIGAAISPSAYFESIETCKTRAQTLTAQDGFVTMCLELARARDIEILFNVKDYSVDTVCHNRARSEIFSGESKIPGTVCEDALLDSDIPTDCRYVMVSAAQILSSGEPDSHTVSGPFVSLALSRLVAVHGSGFAVGLEDGLENFTGDAILRLDPYNLRPLVGQRSMRLVKTDLEKFQGALVKRFEDKSLIRDFGNWIRKIRIDRTEMLPVSEFTEWIDRFANSNPKKRKSPEDAPHILYLRTPAIAEFLPLFSFCKNESQQARSEDAIEDGHEFTLVASREKLTAIERIDGGKNADIFITSDPNLLIKNPYSRSAYCLELAALTALKGLGGRVPELHEVENPIGRMMVMRRVGDTDWPLSINLRRPSNEHLAQVIEIIRDLHQAGFVHRDLHEHNVRMDAQRVFLIDFGMVRPIYSNGADVQGTRRFDMMMVAESFITPYVPRGLEMLADMDALFDDERPDYEKWITHFRSIL